MLELLTIIQIIIVLTRLDVGTQLAYLVINIILVLYVFVAMAFVLLLLGFHIFLSYRGTTTNEYCKDAWATISGNPFSKYG